MTNLRKLEIGCGIATGVLGIAITVNAITEDYGTMRRLEQEFSIIQELMVASIMYVLPALLVVIGSYLHASRLRAWRPLMLIGGSVWLVVTFLLLLFAPAFYGPSLFAWLNLSLAAMAVVTVLVSLGAHFLDPVNKGNSVH